MVAAVAVVLLLVLGLYSCSGDDAPVATEVADEGGHEELALIEDVLVGETASSTAEVGPGFSSRRRSSARPSPSPSASPVGGGSGAPPSPSKSPPPPSKSPRGFAVAFDSAASAESFSRTGGTWAVDAGALQLRSPVYVAGQVNSNLAVHRTPVSGDYVVQGRLRALGAPSEWEDVSLVFGYQDADNYLFVSLNERNDGQTHGLFRVADGVSTELVDFPGNPLVAGVWRGLEVRVAGSVVTVRSDGVLLGTWTGATGTAGRVGYGTRNDAGDFDDLQVLS